MKFLVIKKSLIAVVLSFCLMLGVYNLPITDTESVASVFFGIFGRNRTKKGGNII